jgi:hypothetical protein
MRIYTPYKILFFGLVCLTLVYAQGCKKDTKASYNITYSGDLLIDDRILFSCGAQPPGNFSWDFGDGSTSTAYLPAHVYTAAGTFTVSFIVNSASVATKNIVVRSSLYDFSYTGTLWTFSPIAFQSNAPTNSTFLWDFGDGTTSTDSTPTHTYTVINHTGFADMLCDNVSLTINGDTQHRVIKALKITPGASRLAGTWSWTGGYFYPFGNPNPGIAHALNDTVFAITAVNDSTINVWGQTLPFRASSNAFCYPNGYSWNTSLFVGYARDTIFFTNSSGGVMSWNEVHYHFP